jgi:hypothetical protein
MMYKHLNDLNKNGHIWNIKEKVMRLCESVNNKTEELMSLDMILMDDKVSFFYIHVRLKNLNFVTYTIC